MSPELREEMLSKGSAVQKHLTLVLFGILLQHQGPVDETEWLLCMYRCQCQTMLVWCTQWAGANTCPNKSVSGNRIRHSSPSTGEYKWFGHNPSGSRPLVAVRNTTVFWIICSGFTTQAWLKGVAVIEVRDHHNWETEATGSEHVSPMSLQLYWDIIDPRSLQDTLQDLCQACIICTAVIWKTM